MTLLLGDTGKSQIGALKTFTITPPGVLRETLLTGGGVLTLPTAEPTDSQVIFTLQASDLPTISPSIPMKYNASLVVSGKVGTTVAVLNYRVLKNGVSVAQASANSQTALNFWTHTHWRTFDVQIGDVLEVRYWADKTDVTLDFYGLGIIPSQPEVSKRGSILKDLYLNTTSSEPAFLSTTFSPVNTQNYFIHPYSIVGGTTNDWSFDATVNRTVLCLAPNASYGLFRTSNAERNATTSNLGIHATQRQIQRQCYPKVISFREVLR